MHSPVGLGILVCRVMVAKVILDHSAAGHLLGPVEPGPMHQETLAANSATYIASGMRELTVDMIHKVDFSFSEQNTVTHAASTWFYSESYLSMRFHRHATKAVSEIGKHKGTPATGSG